VASFGVRQRRASYRNVNRRYFNANGQNWGYTDVEYSWNVTHQDLNQIAGNVFVNGSPSSGAMRMDYRDHGTAVMGILSSDDNGFGTTGLVPQAAVRLSTHSPATGYNPANAITAAASQFWKGAAILLEMQTYAGFDCNGPDSREDLVPIEWDAAAKAAIKTAVANGRIVIEAAGNGNCDLDQAGFKGAFNSNDAAKDSGAIIVGAGQKLTRNRAGFSSFGSRVDTHAEGDNRIYTTGYGDKYNSEGENHFYTDEFGGTSGASPMVTGAAVSLASMLWEYHGSFWDPKEMRDLLRREGTPQGTGEPGDIPRFGDTDGNGWDEYIIWRPSTGVWWNLNTGTQIWWGLPGDIAIAR